MYPRNPPVDPLFDPGLVECQLPADWIFHMIKIRMRYHAAGEKADFHDEFTPGKDAPGTDVDVLACLEVIRGHGETEDRILTALEDLRERGVLKPIPTGADRGIGMVTAWNAFVEGGCDALSKEEEEGNFLQAPLPFGMNMAFYMAGAKAISEIREEAGLERRVMEGDRTGPGAPLHLTDDHIRAVSKRVSETVAGVAAGTMVGTSLHNPSCPRTGDHLIWDQNRRDSLVAPSLQKAEWEPGSRSPKFKDLEPYHPPKPIRHFEIAAPSGTLLMADWFRIPGFNEGVETGGPGVAPGDHDINSDQGMDERTRDYHERLGLTMVQTTNCTARITREGDAFRVGYVDDEHDVFWRRNAETGEDEPSGVTPPESAGRVCCDLWAVTFADREVLADILVDGERYLEATEGDTSGCAATRQEALDLLDAYMSGKDFVTRLDVDPSRPLHVYMATGADYEKFAENFSSPDIPAREWMEDMFILSTRALEVDPDLVEEADWEWPQAYAARAAEIDDSPAM